MLLITEHKVYFAGKFARFR